MIFAGLPFCKSVTGQGAALACEIYGSIAVIYGPVAIVLLGLFVFAVYAIFST